MTDEQIITNKMTYEEVHKKMTTEEEVAWYESGLSSDGCELDNWDKDAIVRYGRILHEQLLSEMHSLRMQNSGQAALLESKRTTNAISSDIKELKKAIADTIKYIPQPFCPLLNHSKKDRHHLFDPCPLEERIKLKIKKWKELAK